MLAQISNFSHTSIHKIFKIIETRDRTEKELINANSFVNAIGWSALIKAFGGEVEYTDLLPYKFEDKKKEYLKADTLTIIKKLIISNKLNRMCVSVIGNYIDDSFFEEINKIKSLL